MRKYFNASFLEAETKKTSSMIYRSLLKYGYSVFTLEILEYCKPSEVFSREQYYLDLLKPDYNILKIAGSSLGFKHSEETIAKLKGRILSEEHKSKVSEHLRTLHFSKEHQEFLKEHLKNLNASKAYKIVVFDTLENKTIVQPSIVAAAVFMGSGESTIRHALKPLQEKGVFSRLIKKRYRVRRE
jgi:group I intron endonuclease